MRPRAHRVLAWDVCVLHDKRVEEPVLSSCLPSLRRKSADGKNVYPKCRGPGEWRTVLRAVWKHVCEPRDPHYRGQFAHSATTAAKSAARRPPLDGALRNHGRSQRSQAKGWRNLCFG